MRNKELLDSLSGFWKELLQMRGWSLCFIRVTINVPVRVHFRERKELIKIFCV